MTTGDRIRNARRHAKMTQTELGKALGVSGSMVAQYETGKRNPKKETLDKIAAAINAKDKSRVIHGFDLYGDDELQQKYEAIEDHMLNVLSNKKKFTQFSEAEAVKSGILDISFNSDRDRIAFFYSRLNIDGKLAASQHFFKHLDPTSINEVADFIEKLSEDPQYQRKAAPSDAATENSEDK